MLFSSCPLKDSGSFASFLRRYCLNSFESERKATIGADFYTKQIVNPLVGNKNITKECPNITDDEAVALRRRIDAEPMVRIQLWDTAGLEQHVNFWTADNSFTNITSSPQESATLGKLFFRGIHGAILVYDATSHKSFSAMIHWHKIFIENTNDESNKVPVIVVANKMDQLKYELVKPFLKMVPQRNVLGISLPASCTENSRIRKFHGLKQMTIQDVKRKAGKNFEANLVSFTAASAASPTSHTTMLRDTTMDNEQQDQIEHSASFLTDEAGIPEEEKSYSLSPNADFYGSQWEINSVNSRQLITSKLPKQNLITEGRGKNVRSQNNQQTVSYKSIWRESTTVDDTLPDRDVVLQWCKTNNITFSEASALDGTGVNEAMESLITLALTQIYMVNHNAAASTLDVHLNQTLAGKGNFGRNYNIGVTANNASLFVPTNKIIDLQARYKTHNNGHHRQFTCCGSLNQCWPFFND